jgi:protein SCO1
MLIRHTIPRAAAAALALAALLAGAPPAAAQFGAPRPEPIVSPDGDARPSQTDDVGFDQKLGSKVPMDVELTDESGHRVTLAKLADGKPVILVPAYYGCPMLCNMVLSGVITSLGPMELDAGRDFEVIVVSFDPGETPEMAAEKKAPLVERYDRPGADAGFHFLTGDEASIRVVMDAIGFRYTYIEERDEYAHVAGIVTLAADGTVTRYQYGVEYAPRDVRLGLIEAGDGTVGSAVDQVLLYCLHYDPATGKYSVAILNLVRIGGVLTVLAIVLFMFVSRRRSRSQVAMGEG